MMYQCLSQMSYEALGTRQLCSVESLRKSELTTDAARRCKFRPALEEYPP